MILFYDIIAKACLFEADRLGSKREPRPVIDMPMTPVKARRARRQEADAACWGK